MNNLSRCLAFGPNGKPHALPLPAGEEYEIIAKANVEYLAMVTQIKRQCRHRALDALGTKPRYHSTEELCLFAGTRTLAHLREMVLPAMTLGACFENAYQIAIVNEEWRYTEGYALMQQSIPTHHAWLTGPNGEVEDPTWRTLAEQNPDLPGRVHYCGVSITRRQLSRWVEHKRHANILAYGEFDLPEALEHGVPGMIERLPR